MGIINCLTKKCVFCGKRKNTKYIKEYGMYSNNMPGNWYHDECIRKVCADPEKYKKYVDIAIDIIDRIETVKKDKERNIYLFKKKCEYIKNKCV